MIRAKAFQDDATLAIVEASTLQELQAATGATVHVEQPDPVWPFSAIVPASIVAHLLSSSATGTP